MIVFHIITHCDLGGAERVAINIASSKNKSIKYHIVEIVRGDSSFAQELISEIQNKKIIIHQSPIANNKIGIILFPFWFTFLFLKWRPNIIHTHTEIPDLSVFLWAKSIGRLFTNIKYVRTIHNTILWTSWNRIGEVVEKFYIKKKANVSISISTKDCYQLKYKETTPIIYNGLIEAKQLKFEKSNPGKYNILFAGRLEYQKGIDELCSVIEKLSNNSSIVFHIVGEGSLKAKIDALKDNSNVRIYNKIYGLSHIIGSFDYLFMPSNHEGLGLISIEASMAKVPTIINTCSGLNETLPEDWPLKVENNSVDQFIEIFRSLDNIDKYALGEKAYQFTIKHFSIAKMQQEYERIYTNHE